jgi:hypothetical protein
LPLAGGTRRTNNRSTYNGHEAKAGVKVTLPVPMPVENIVEQVLGLNLDGTRSRSSPANRFSVGAAG